MIFAVAAELWQALLQDHKYTMQAVVVVASTVLQHKVITE
jgi:hypothetical protein